MPTDYNSSLNIKLRVLEMVGWGQTRIKLSRYQKAKAKYACGDKNLYSKYQQSGTSSNQKNKNLPALAAESVNDRFKEVPNLSSFL